MSDCGAQWLRNGTCASGMSDPGTRNAAQPVRQGEGSNQFCECSGAVSRCGRVNQKTQQAEAVDEVAARIGHAIDLFGRDRLLLHPDCGFATYADNPICCTELAHDKLSAVSRAAERLR